MAPSARLRRGAQLLPRSQIYALLLEGTFSVAILVLASIWAQERTNGGAAAESPPQNRTDQAGLVWYLGTMAMLSTVHAMAELILLLLRRPPSATLTLVALVLLASGWIIQAGFWAGCEGVGGGGVVVIGRPLRQRSSCPASISISAGGSGAFERGVMWVRVALGWALVVFYLVFIGFASVAVHFERMLERDVLRKMREASQTRLVAGRSVILNGRTV